jgi:hypothetical protein
MAIPTQAQLKKAETRRFNALRDLGNSLSAYQMELPSMPFHGIRRPDSARLFQIVGAYARTLWDIEVDLDPDRSRPAIINECWQQIVNACESVQTALHEVRDLPNSEEFRDFIRKALGPNTGDDGVVHDPVSSLKAPLLQFTYPEDLPDAEQLAIENARLQANRDLEMKVVHSYDEHREARLEWFWVLVSAAAKAIGRAGAKLEWSANRRRRMLRDFGMEAAEAAKIAGANAQFFEKICQSAEWRDLDDLLLPAGGVAALQISEALLKPGDRSEVPAVLNDSGDPPFQQGTKDYPYLYALWTASTKSWTFHEHVTGAQGQPDSSQSVISQERGIALLKQATRMAIRRLRCSLNEKVRESAGTLREPLYVWLDLMRANQRGFHLVPQLRSWQGKAIEAFQASGVLPSDARITGNGAILAVFKESAAFWDDLVSLGFESAIPSPSLPAEPRPEEGVANPEPTIVADDPASDSGGESQTVPARETDGVSKLWAADLVTPEGKKAAKEAWKRHWSTTDRECTNDDLTEVAYSQKDAPFLNQWENGKTRLKEPGRSSRIQAIERVLRNNVPPRWHPAAQKS